MPAEHRLPNVLNCMPACQMALAASPWKLYISLCGCTKNQIELTVKKQESVASLKGAITQTLHGTAIYADQLTPKTTLTDRHIWQSHGVFG